MTFPRTLAVGLGAMILLLGGCGGLLGGGGRADLYRFGASVPEAPTVPQDAQALMVLYLGATFERAIEGDRILTVTGTQAAYIAEARWVAPASELFDAAARRAFEQRVPAAHVVRLRGAPVPDYALGIDVRRFEADYVGGPAAPPEIVVEARIRIIRWSDRSVVGEWPVSVRETATENRMPAIVDAFDRATASAVVRLADLTQQALAGQPRLAQRATN
ncbi:MAG: ABC-type transport auxiliary lipoprotein family protein [Allosphingosinicella sp.]